MGCGSSRLNLGRLNLRRWSLGPWKTATWGAPALAGLLLLGSPVSAQQAAEAAVYKWVDAQGVPHYSDQPPASGEAEELVIRYRKTDSGTLAAKAKAKTDDVVPDAGGSQEPTPPADDADRDKVVAEREAGCQRAKDRMSKYEQARRIYRPGANGERIYLTEEELDAERANARRAVDEWCGNE